MVQAHQRCPADRAEDRLVAAGVADRHAAGREDRGQGVALHASSSSKDIVIVAAPVARRQGAPIFDKNPNFVRIHLGSQLRCGIQLDQPGDSRTFNGASAGRFWIMALPAQTISLLEAARQLSKDLKTDAVLFLTETKLDWDVVREHLGRSRLFVAAHDPELTR